LSAPLAAFGDAGQSLWLDSLSRALLSGGELARLVAAGIAGVTTNPTIFAQALRARSDYAADIGRCAHSGLDARATYARLVGDDVRAAADLLRPVWEASGRRDGHVSVEVDPATAHDTAATIAEAERWWSSIARPNLMIKVPATAAGLRALAELVRRGRSVNATLVFGLEQYSRTIEAWLEGLARRHADGGELGGVGSVASVFLSRVDTAVDARLDALATTEAAALRGCAALALARLAYQRYRALVDDPRWVALREAGAGVQRLLWASTGTKDARLSDTHYVERLALPGTVNTLPPETLAAVIDHGRPRSEDLAPEPVAAERFARLAALGIEPSALALELQQQGIEKFAASFHEALQAIR
jgi:transaldolase